MSLRFFLRLWFGWWLEGGLGGGLRLVLRWFQGSLGCALKLVCFFLGGWWFEGGLRVDWVVV